MQQEVIDLASSSSDDDDSIIRSCSRRPSRNLSHSPDNSPPRARLRRDDAPNNESGLNSSTNPPDGLLSAASAVDRQRVIELMDSPEGPQQSSSSSRISSTRHDNSQRNRDRHRREDNDPSTNNQWACQRCTLLNSNHSSICSACHSSRHDDEVIYEGTTTARSNHNNNNSQHPTSHYIGGGAFLGGMIGAADGYANGTGIARGAVRGAVSGAVGGVLMREAFRDAPLPPRPNYPSGVASAATTTAAAAGASYRTNGPISSSDDGWGRRTNTTNNNHAYPSHHFNAYPMQNRTYIRNNPTIFDQFFQSMNHYHNRHQPNIDNMSYEQILETFGDGNENRNLAASPQVISALPSRTISNLSELPEDKRQCVICMEEYQAGDERTMLPCWHDFHKGCVNRWLSSKGSCPVCKTEVG